jgi:hypothetical protein
MKRFPIQKVDTDLYIKGLSGPLVFRALYGILIALGVFVALYLLIGPLTAVLISVPPLFIHLLWLGKIQKNPGPRGYAKRKMAAKLPQFIRVKRRLEM